MGGLRADLQLEEEILFGLRSKSEPSMAPPASAASVPGLAGLRQQAESDAGKCFPALLHHIDVELLKSAYRLLKIEGARGGGGRTWMQYGEQLDANAIRLYTRLQQGEHRTLPSWRRMMALAQGQRASLKRAALKDRIVQRAVAIVLGALYEADFLSFVRGPNDERSMVQLEAAKPRWMVQVPIGRYHEAIDHAFLRRSLAARIGDPLIMRLLEAWLEADLLDEAAVDEEAPMPLNSLALLLTQVYYHYGFDVWAERWRQRHARSPVLLARNREALVALFEHKPGARRFQLDLRARLKQFMPRLPSKRVRLSAFVLGSGDAAT